MVERREMCEGDYLEASRLEEQPIFWFRLWCLLGETLFGKC